MGILPGFFDFGTLTAADIAVICLISAVVPLTGNLLMGLFVGRIRALISSPGSVRRMNLSAGVLLILVGIFIAIF